MSRIVIIGATSGIAKACARQWLASGPHTFVLVGRSAPSLSAVGADLVVRSPHSTFEVQTADFIDPVSIRSTISRIEADGPIDVALIAHGWMPTQDECADLGTASNSLVVNGVSPALFAEAIVPGMSLRKQGTIAIIGSVAGDRGRKSNYTYGSAKSMLHTFARGLQHRLAGTGVRVVLIKPGPTDSPMTADVQSGGTRVANVDLVAKAIVRGITERRATVYAPARWALIMLIVRALPASIFNRLNL